MFIKRRKNIGPIISPSCSHQGLRYLLFLSIFLAVTSAYWWNFERRLENIRAEAKHAADTFYTVQNDHNLFSDKEIQELSLLQENLKNEQKLSVYIDVNPHMLSVPEFDANALYVGAGLKHHEAVIIFPPKLKNSLGEGLRMQAEENLAACLPKQSPATCLINAVTFIGRALP